MYPEYNKVNSFLAEAELLKETSMQMKDIYNAIITRNKNNIAVEFVNERGKIKHYKYKKVAENVLMYAAGIQRKLKDQAPGSVVVLKHANAPAWP